MIQLRDYQKLALEQIKAQYAMGHRKIIVMCATGSGKGLMMAQIVKKYLERDMSVMSIMKMRSIVFQTVENYRKYFGIDSSLLMGDESRMGVDDSVVASIDTAYRRRDDLSTSWNAIIVDEAHLSTSKKYRDLLDSLDSGHNIFLGFTATPFHIGNKGHTWWDTYVEPIKPYQLRDQGFLVPCKIKIPAEKIDTSDVAILSTGDFNLGQLEEVASVPRVVKSLVDHYKKYSMDKKAIVFAVSVEHSKKIASEFCSQGIPAVHCDASTPQDERMASIKALERGSIKVITNVNIFSTGVDMPFLEVGIMARPTRSEVLYIQQIGRLLRTSTDKKEALVLDHTDNTERFGGPYDIDRLPAMDDRARRKKEEKNKARRCPACESAIPQFVKKCPICGHEIIIERVVDEVVELKDYEEKTFDPKKLETIKNKLYPSKAHVSWHASKAGNKCLKIEYVIGKSDSLFNQDSITEFIVYNVFKEGPQDFHNNIKTNVFWRKKVEQRFELLGINELQVPAFGTVILDVSNISVYVVKEKGFWKITRVSRTR